MSNKKYASLSTLQAFLTNLRNTFSELSHKHNIEDITDYVVDAELSATSTNPVQNKTIDAEFEAVATAINALDLAIDNKADASHDHNDVYYTKEEIDEAIQNSSSEGDFVSYNAQDLTSEQKSQARKNIGVSEMIADTLIAMDLISTVVEDEGGSLAEEDGVLLVVRNDELFLPTVTAENNGSVLQVVDGKWTPYLKPYSAARIAYVDLLAANWVGDANPYSQVVAIDGVTEYSQVDLTPSIEQLVVFYEKDLGFVTENEDGVVTVYAIGQKPENDYTIQVTITEVDV